MNTDNAHTHGTGDQAPGFSIWSPQLCQASVPGTRSLLITQFWENTIVLGWDSSWKLWVSWIRKLLFYICWPLELSIMLSFRQLASWLCECVAEPVKRFLSAVSVCSFMFNSCDPVDCRSPGFSVHGIFQARILEWVTISYSRGSSWPRDWTWVFCISCMAGEFFTASATWEAPF